MIRDGIACKLFDIKEKQQRTWTCKAARMRRQQAYNHHLFDTQSKLEEQLDATKYKIKVYKLPGLQDHVWKNRVDKVHVPVVIETDPVLLVNSCETTINS